MIGWVLLDQCCDSRVEILTGDDASTDVAAAIIRDHAARYPTIFRTVRMTEDQFSTGVNPFFGHVFPAARGDSIAICDGDDFGADPVKLARQAAMLDAESGIAPRFGRVRGLDETGADTPHRDLLVWAMPRYHGSALFLPDRAPVRYRLHSGGLISMPGRARQIMMTAIALMHLAGYHLEKNDAQATAVAMGRMVAQFNTNRMGALVYLPASAVSLRIRFSLLRKRVSHWGKRVTGATRQALTRANFLPPPGHQQVRLFLT